MMVGWLKNIFASHRSEAVSQGAQAFKRKTRAKLIDLAEEGTVTEEARTKGTELLSMVRKGGAQIDRLRLWLRTRRKVKRHIAKAYDVSEIADEVTEKILEAAKEDPFYRRLVG